MQEKLRDDALKILHAGLSVLKPEKILNKKIWNQFKLPSHQKIYVIGAGKGVRFLAKQLENILGNKIAGGFVNDIEKLPLNTSEASVLRRQSRIVVNQSSHPLPDKSSLAGTQKIIKLIRETTKKDLIICLFAGGGSALLTWPTFAVRRVGEFYDKLLKSGANIYAMNVIRKHIDRVKGGGLSSFIYPRPCLSLIVSDIPGNNLSTIASGPTVFNHSTKEEAEEIFEKYNLPRKIEGSPIRLIETPKDKKIFKNVKNILLATNRLALDVMKKKAESLGYDSKILYDDLQGEASGVGQMLIKARKSDKGEVLLAGGETTVKVTSRQARSKGGRNTHLCLSALKYLLKNTVLLSVDSDGQDNTDAAGAIISEETIKKARELNLEPEEYLGNFDSYNFFKKTGDLIKTGPLPLNVGDLLLVLKSG